MQQSFHAGDGIALASDTTGFTHPWPRPATPVLSRAATGSPDRQPATVPPRFHHDRVIRGDLCGHGSPGIPSPDPPPPSEIVSRPALSATGAALRAGPTAYARSL